MLKDYRVTISFGDGNPKTVNIKAKNGYAAKEKALESFAGARQVHVLGLTSNTPKEKPVSVQPNLMYGDEFDLLRKKLRPKVIPIHLENSSVNPLVLEAVRLRKEGLSQQKVATALGITRGTVRRLLNTEY